jgi:hypothetical protein
MWSLLGPVFPYTRQVLYHLITLSPFKKVFKQFFLKEFLPYPEKKEPWSFGFNS